ncbi:nonsense-mediated mRNA decay protein 2-like [Punica granatum]|uniref:Uncharacterized protein n=2 Tax=Punica granatum TaxID=22663 RepID=A0A2I0JIS9_PUNGR|nr:nonsense-mediated mRNA decay protein 2-like [Punica granatum]PKI56169.1 hypothetical protein CRG98_023437 [Punica granatum]
MKLVLVPILSFVIVISFAFVLVSSRLAFGNRDCTLAGWLLSSPLFMFSVFNTVVLAVLLGSHDLGSYEVANHFILSSDEEDVRECDGHNYKGQFSDDDGVGGDDEDSSDSDQNVEDSSDSDQNADSAGYDEDDDDSGGEDEIGWEDEGEQDGDCNLEKRIEDFIDKVITGWREERMKENLTEV